MLTIAALLLAVGYVLYEYWPVLAPLGDGRLVFNYGDFNTNIGPESADARKEATMHTFYSGGPGFFNNRFFMLGGLSILSDYAPFSDAQFHSALILVSLLLGSWGIYRLVGMFHGPGLQAALLVLAVLPFYFMNLWSVERIVHTWIWFTYAILPLFLSLGLSYAKERKGETLVAYSLLLGFYGIIPHSLFYMLLTHAVAVAFLAFSDRKIGPVALFALAPIALYAILNLPILALGEFMDNP